MKQKLKTLLIAALKYGGAGAAGYFGGPLAAQAASELLAKLLG